ncbi:hypothetical protein LEP1GSC188_3838 [Leptospira weilii serovar Topaz str. LT2116]|uniref:Uncharacterized protein n=1 Tax=Leptospira weilii serovar Topaz str. LT2116 TaxID=1088540 RepID=M3G3W6_9LEPT|nr:hypothetical protein LEP1GSC188_3838 [Leptospira weilii serovar Topaz str. LT2116]
MSHRKFRIPFFYLDPFYNLYQMNCKFDDILSNSNGNCIESIVSFGFQ